MDNLLNKFKPEVIEALNEYAIKYPHTVEIAVKELAVKEFVNDISFQTYSIIYDACNLEGILQIFSLLKDKHDTTNNG